MGHLPRVRSDPAHAGIGCLGRPRREQPASGRRVTGHSLFGVFSFDAVVVLVGATVLWGLGAINTRRDAVRLIGLSWLVGTAALAGLLALELMVAVPFGLTTVFVTAAGIAAAGAGRGWVARRARPTAKPVTRAPALIAAIGIGAAAVVVEEEFRAGRFAGLYEWDAMAFWVPKAKAIYYFGQFDPAFVAHLRNAWYPPLVPTLDATAFSFMGSADVVTLHLVYVSALAAFVAAVAGLLAPYVEAVFLWPPLLALSTAPVLVHRATAPLADLLLDYFLAIAAILVALWLSGSARWCLVLAGGLLGGAAFTKREGLLLAACVIAAGMFASWSSKRRAWPALVATAVPALALTLIWRVWLSRHGIANQAPETGYFGFTSHLGRVWPSLHLTLHVLYSGDSWLFVPVIIVVGTFAALSTRSGEVASFAGAYFVLGVLACSWVTLSFPSLPLSTDDALNPIVRLSGGLVIPAAAILPLVLNAAWRRAGPARGDSAATRHRTT